jgi:osmotically-inducible protein OsmY
MLKRILVILLIMIGLSGSLTASAASNRQEGSVRNFGFTESIRKQLAKLPYYGVFDNLAFELNGNTVVLYGQVLRPTTKKEAERRVAKMEGVERVINKIEVLPPSSFDDSIRRRVYNAVFRTGGLYRYAMGANPSIHIVVNRGRVSLEGVVSNQMDSQLADMAAKSVPGVFSVTNNLRIEKQS